MVFPEDPPEIIPPFVVTTPVGTEVHTIEEFTTPLSRTVNLQNGNVTIVFQRPDERDAAIQELKAKIEALQNEKQETEQKLERVVALASRQDFEAIAAFASPVNFDVAEKIDLKPVKKKKAGK